MSKDWDPNLTPEQNYVLKQEGTESPGSSPLNHEKERVLITVLGVEQNYLSLLLNMRVVQAGLHFQSIPGVFEEKKRYAHWLSKN